LKKWAEAAERKKETEKKIADADKEKKDKGIIDPTDTTIGDLDSEEDNMNENIETPIRPELPEVDPVEIT